MTITTNPLSSQGKYINTIVSKCRKKKGFLPDLNPQIYGLSMYTSTSGVYTIVNIVGNNFFPYGTTMVDFGSYRNISVNFYSSLNISFVIPIIAPPGVYIIKATSNTNQNFNPFLLYSNPVTYTLI